MNDPYQILGVNKKASAEEIKAAYRKMAKKLHPDLNPGNREIENKFKEATAAYEFLSDTDKRRKYDLGEIDANGQPRFRQARNPYGRAGARNGDFVFEDESTNFAEDIFRDVFGFGKTRGQPNMRMRGADVSYRAEIDFIEAALGGRKRLSLADGKVLEISIPAGTESGQTLRLKGQGLGGTGGGASGDAFIEVTVKPHSYFVRDNIDIHLEVPVTLAEASQGATITVPTVQGKVSLKIPAGSSSGTQLRLRGKGVAKGNAIGDQYVKLSIMLPPKIDPELNAAIEKSAKLYPYQVRQKFEE